MSLRWAAPGDPVPSNFHQRLPSYQRLIPVNFSRAFKLFIFWPLNDARFLTSLSDINKSEVVVHEVGQDFSDRCDQQVMVQTNLKTHEVVHEGAKYLADQCD